MNDTKNRNSLSAPSRISGCRIFLSIPKIEMRIPKFQVDLAFVSGFFFLHRFSLCYCLMLGSWKKKGSSYSIIFELQLDSMRLLARLFQSFPVISIFLPNVVNSSSCMISCTIYDSWNQNARQNENGIGSHWDRVSMAEAAMAGDGSGTGCRCPLFFICSGHASLISIDIGYCRFLIFYW